MPFYELFCLARPELARSQKAELLRLASKAVFSHGGVLTDMKSFGERTLAYRISRAGRLFTEVTCLKWTHRHVHIFEGPSSALDWRSVTSDCFGIGVWDFNDAL